MKWRIFSKRLVKKNNISEKDESRCRTGVLNALRNFEELSEKRLQRITEAVIDFFIQGEYSYRSRSDVLVGIGKPDGMSSDPLATEVEYVLKTLADEKFLDRNTQGQYWFRGFGKWPSHR